MQRQILLMGKEHDQYLEYRAASEVEAIDERELSDRKLFGELEAQLNAANEDEVRDDVVRKAIRVLLQDAERCDGKLSREDVDRRYLKRQLTISECIAVEQAILNQGIPIVSQDEEKERTTSKPKRMTFLTEEEEKECGRKVQLAQKIGNCDVNLDKAFTQRAQDEARKAIDLLVRTNLRYVWKRARSARKSTHLSLEDLVQEGAIGLLRAALLYDPDKGFRFKTYATWWIDQRINRAIGDLDRAVRLPIHIQEKLRKVQRSQHRLRRALGSEPSTALLADALGIEEENLMKLLWRVQVTNCTEGDAPTPTSESLLSLQADPDSDSQFKATAHDELKARLSEVLTTLTAREERIIRLRYGLDKGSSLTLENIGQEFGVTRERIRQIEEKALKRLRHPSRKKRLEGFLD